MIRLAVRVRRDDAELVLAELLELAPTGVEEVPERDGVIEFAVYGAPGELPSLHDLEAAAKDALVEVSTSEIADDWAERWRKFHQPVLVDAPRAMRGGARVPSLRITPPWTASDDTRSAALREIVIDPAQAFGTGSHATTRLCLELLLDLAACDPARGAVVDVGSGSGVLAIAAAILGYAPVLAVDNERESVDAARANAAANGVELDARLLDIRDVPPPLPTTETVVLANLLAPLLVGLAGALERAPAHLIAGGLLHDQADAVSREFARRLALCERGRRARGEWVALWLARE